MKKLLVIGLLFSSVVSAAEISTYNPYSLQPQPMPSNNTPPPPPPQQQSNNTPPPAPPASVNPTIPPNWDPRWNYDRK